MTRRSRWFAPLLAPILLLPGPAGAVTITWNGLAGDNLWHTPGNWDLARVPGAGDDVVIPDLAGTPSVTYFTGTTSIQSLDCTESVILAGGTLDIAAASTFRGPFRLDGFGGITGAGNITVTGAFTLNGGTLSGTGLLTVPAGVTWTLNAGALGRNVNNSGTARHQGTASITLAAGKTFTNFSGATYEFVSDGRLVGIGNFQNQNGALIRKSGGLTASPTGSSLDHNVITNQGTIRIEAGRFQFFDFTNADSLISLPGTEIECLAYVSGTTVLGDFVTSSGSLLQVGGRATFHGKTATIASGSNVVFSDRVDATGGTTTINRNVSIPNLNQSTTLTGSGNITVTSNYSWLGGTLSGTGSLTVSAGASLSMSTSLRTLSRTLINLGSGSQSGSSNTRFSSGGRFQNGGTFALTSSAGFDTIAAGTSVDNLAGGTFTMNGGGLSSVIQSPMTNSGSVVISSGGTLTLSRRYQQQSGGTTINGTLTASLPVQLNNGGLGGNGTLNGSLVNSAGQVAPGSSAGRLTINGNYSQDGDGSLLIELGGTTPDTGFDRLTVSGTATLGGNVFVTLINGFDPPSNTDFKFLTCGTRAGTFGFASLPGLAPRCPYVRYDADGVSFRVTGVAITQQPQSQTVCGGQPASLSVTATGDNLAYQWRKNGVAIAGATASTLNFPALQRTDAGRYDVIFTGNCQTDTSDVAVLTYKRCTASYFNTQWSAGSGLYPDAQCPWQLVDSAVPETPTLANGVLTLSSSTFLEDMAFQQVTSLAIPDTFLMAASVKYVSENHMAGNPRRGVAINFTVAPDSSNRVFIAQDTVFIWSALSVQGPTALVDTDGGFHTYLIEVIHHFDLFVYQDNILILSGAITVSPLHEDLPILWWGEKTSVTNGTSQWQYVQHNGSSVTCGATSSVPDGPVPDPEPGGGLSFRVAPNPARGPVTAMMDAPAGLGESILDVHDVTGRLVRRIPIGIVPGGRLVVRWDGLDEAGRAAANGLYFLRLVSGGKAAASGKLMIAR